MHKLNQKGALPLIVLISLVGVLIFVLISSSADFKNKLFGQLFPKDSSYAASNPIATNPPMVFKSSSGQPLPTDSSGTPVSAPSASLKIEFNFTLPSGINVANGVGGGQRVKADSYRFSESQENLAKMPYTLYTKHPTVVNYTFKDQTSGQKFIWVDFAAPDGRTARRSAAIVLVLPAPEMDYPQDGQVLDYKGDWVFKVKPVGRASGYLFGFFQNKVMVYENDWDGNPLSTDGSFRINLDNPTVQSKFKPGAVEVWVRALVRKEWTDARKITVYLR